MLWEYFGFNLHVSWCMSKFCLENMYIYVSLLLIIFEMGLKSLISTSVHTQRAMELFSGWYTFTIARPYISAPVYVSECCVTLENRGDPHPNICRPNSPSWNKSLHPSQINNASIGQTNITASSKVSATSFSNFLPSCEPPLLCDELASLSSVSGKKNEKIWNQNGLPRWARRVCGKQLQSQQAPIPHSHRPWPKKCFV